MLTPTTPIPLTLSSLSALAALSLTLLISFLHLREFSHPALQKSTIRIVWVVGVYACGSWLSVVFPEELMYFVSVRDIYEAYVIYLFLVLIIDFAGGTSMCATALAERKKMPHPWPFQRFSVSLGGTFLRRAKQWTLQFVIVKPIFALCNIILLPLGEYNNKVYQWIILVVYNFSYTAALTGLLYVYLATKDMISHYQPVKKFLTVKGVVFMTYYQGLAVISLPYFTREEGEIWNSFILSIEMFFFAIAVFAAFPVSEFREDSKKNSGTHQAIQQSSHHQQNQNYSKVPFSTAVLQVLSIRDVIDDTVTNFHPRNTGREVEGFHGVNLLRMDFSRDRYHVTNTEGERIAMAEKTAKYLAENC